MAFCVSTSFSNQTCFSSRETGSSIFAAGVPGRGEKIKVKSASNCVFSTRSTVCIASSSVSPGKPMMTSLVSTMLGMTLRA